MSSETTRTDPPTRKRPSRARQTLRVLWWGWKADFAGATEYRVDLVSGTVVSVIWLAISVAPTLIVAGHVGAADGWTLPRLLFVQAVWYLLDAMVWMLLMVNVTQWTKDVQMGTLDALLLRPVSSLVLCSLGRLNVQDIPKVVLALGLGVVAVMLGGGPVGIAPTIAAIMCIGAALVLMWAAGVLANYKTLSQVKFDGMFLLFGVHDLARVPVPLYGPMLRVVLTVVVPVAFLTTVPAQMFFGDASLWLAPAAVGIAAGAVVLTSVLWRRELRRYTGAMG